MKQYIINTSYELTSEERRKDSYCFAAITAFETLNQEVQIPTIMMDISSSPAMTVEFRSKAVMTNLRSVV